MVCFFCMRRFSRCAAILAVLSVAVLTQPRSASADDLQVSPQEIRDIVTRGVQNNRSPEDIQEDLDGLNQARGGTGTVPMPYSITQVQTRNGPVTMTTAEAQTYRDAQQNLAWQNDMQSMFTEDLQGLREDSAYWTGWQETWLMRMIRAAAATYELMELQSAYEKQMAALERDRRDILREPDRMGLNPAYEAYTTYEERMEAWRNRDERIVILNRVRDSISNAHIDRLQAMIDPNDTLGISSMLDRPRERLNDINARIAENEARLERARGWAAERDATMSEYERRATGEGGPRVSLPLPDTAALRRARTPTRAAAGDQDSAAVAGTAGARDGDSTAGGARAEGGSATSEGGSDSGGAGGQEGGSDDDDLSLDDLLAELGADEEADTSSGPRTVLVNEELLADLQGQFDAAADELEQCSGDFIARIRTMAGVPGEEICADGQLAAAFSCAEFAYSRCADVYARAHDLLRSRDPGFDWEEMQMESDLNEGGRVSSMDQITIVLINTKYDNIAGRVEEMRSQLAANAPGCSPDDLVRSGTMAGGGSDGGTGDGGSDGGGGGSGGGSGGGGSGGDSGGGTGGREGEDYYFVKLWEPQVQSNGSTASCQGATLKIERRGMNFPDEIHPERDYTVWIDLSWTCSQSGYVEDVSVSTSIMFLDPANVQLKDYTTVSGSGKVGAQFSTLDVDFSREGGVITIAYGGTIDCEESSGSTGGTVITQAYRRVAY